jgi:hypothetical protein
VDRVDDRFSGYAASAIADAKLTPIMDKAPQTRAVRSAS